MFETVKERITQDCPPDGHIKPLYHAKVTQRLPYLVLGIVNPYQRKITYIQVADPYFALVYSMNGKRFDNSCTDPEYLKFTLLITDDKDLPNISPQLGQEVNGPGGCADFVTFWL
jgi:hypothetical protein